MFHPAPTKRSKGRSDAGWALGAEEWVRCGAWDVVRRMMLGEGGCCTHRVGAVAATEVVVAEPRLEAGRQAPLQTAKNKQVSITMRTCGSKQLIEAPPAASRVTCHVGRDARARIGSVTGSKRVEG